MKPTEKPVLAAARYRAPENFKEKLTEFYQDQLGMTEFLVVNNESSGGTTFAYSSEERSTKLKFEYSEESEPFSLPGRDSVYWKIGVAVDEADKACDCLEIKPSQFLDVGYLAHTHDPLGQTVEILQTTFQDNEAARNKLLKRFKGTKPTDILGQKRSPVVGQITTRASDIKKTKEFYIGLLGMELCCVEPVEKYGFELYFFAFLTEDERGSMPDKENASAVENREWCYSLRCTTLEVQVGRGGELERAGREVGFQGLEIEVGAEEVLRGEVFEGLFAGMDKVEKGREYVVEDPDGVRIWVRLV